MSIIKVSDPPPDYSAACLEGSGLIVCSTERSKAAFNEGGNCFPLFCALARIPAQARALKKYLRGIEPVTRTCDNEDSFTTLGDSEKLSVERAPCDTPFGAGNDTRARPPAAWYFKGKLSAT